VAKLLGIDIGTSGCKCLLVDENGKLLKTASSEYPIFFPHPSWAEQNPEDWYDGVLRCLEQIGERKPDAIGVTGQMHGSVFLDVRGEVIRPAILWNDQRTVLQCEAIERAVGPERLRAISCNPALTGFQAPKILWLRENEPEAFARISKVLLPKDYIRFRLSGKFFTDVSDASGTGLFDVPRRTWSEEICESLGILAEWLPECCESDVALAKTPVGGWFEAGIPIVAGGGDQASAAVGTGAVVPGITSVSLGTSGVVFATLPEVGYDPVGATHTFCHANRGWHAMGVMLSCGGALRWFRDTMATGQNYGELARRAATVQVGAAGARFLPYLSGERCPYVDPAATAAFVNIRNYHGPDHLARAVFEACTAGLSASMELLVGLGATKQEVRITGGGAKSSFWVQMIADMFNCRCATLEIDEGPAFGAAILAGVSAGIWADVAVASKMVVKEIAEFYPSGVSYETVKVELRDLYLDQLSRRIQT
jgi:xylulokinase